MLSISVTGADNEEGLQELREFDKLLNKSFTITHKSSIKFTKIYYYKKKYLNTNRSTIDRIFNESNILQAAIAAGFAVPIQDATYTQQQSNLIHQANVFQGVNLIYSVNTN
ncbi:MAG: RebB family R body protein [Angelakisella sp.]